jgi:hypothetical protein
MKITDAANRFMLILILAVLALGSSGYAASDDVSVPKEYGVYAKTEKGLTRIISNIVHDEQRVLYVERTKPAIFPLNAVQYFIIYGKHDMQYLTLNNLKELPPTNLGIQRYMLGLEIDLEVRKKSDILYTVKPKGLFGRGYYALWINDAAWDFIIE